MSFMRKEAGTFVSTPLPWDLPNALVLSYLHKHDNIIKLSPQVEDYKLISGDPNGTATYSVTDRKPIGKTTYELTITNVADGVNTEVTAHPPLGTLKINSEWRLVAGANGFALQENVKIDAHRMMVNMVKGNIDKTHKEQHQRIFAAA